jgi:hypothetical protein
LTGFTSQPSTANLEGKTFTTAKCSGAGCWGGASAGVYGSAYTPTTLAQLKIDNEAYVAVDPVGRRLLNTRPRVDNSFSGALAISTPGGKTIKRTFGDANDYTYAQAAPGTKGASVSLSLSHSYAAELPKGSVGRSWSVSRTVGSKGTDAATLTSAGTQAGVSGLDVGTYAATGLMGGGSSKSSSYLSGSTKNRKMLMA